MLAIELTAEGAARDARVSTRGNQQKEVIIFYRNYRREALRKRGAARETKVRGSPKADEFEVARNHDVIIQKHRKQRKPTSACGSNFLH